MAELESKTNEVMLEILEPGEKVNTQPIQILTQKHKPKTKLLYNDKYNDIGIQVGEYT